MEGTVTFAWYWLPVAFAVGCLVVWCWLTDWRLRNKLTQEQLFLAMDLIDVECDRNTPDQVREMRDELYRYLNNPDPYHVSTELWKILERVKDVKTIQ